MARPAALLAVALVVGACSVAGAAVPSGSASTEPRDPDTPVFVVGHEGGFVHPVTTFSRLPLIVVYGDGRVIVQGPQIEIWPSPLLPNLQEQTLSPEALERLIELARSKGLLADAHYDMPLIADAADTVLTINLDGETYRVSAYALGEGSDLEAGDAIDDVTRAGRQALREFIDALTGIPAEDFVDEARPFEASAFRLYVTAAAPADPELGVQEVVAWPLEDLATAGVVQGEPSLGVRCVEVRGEELDQVLPLLRGANVMTPFESAGETYSLVVRPQLPGEAGC